MLGIFSFKTGCPEGTYGSNCQNPCKCMNGGHCDPASGTCDCAPGFIGANCSKSKPTFMFCFCQNTAKRSICIKACQKKTRQIPATSSLNCKSGFQLCKKISCKIFSLAPACIEARTLTPGLQPACPNLFLEPAQHELLKFLLPVQNFEVEKLSQYFASHCGAISFNKWEKDQVLSW